MVDDYNTFKQDLISKSRCLPIDVIEAVVGEYESVIDSKRRISCIKNFKELILVLEKRCHVFPEDYSKLQNIVNRLPEEDKNTMLARLNHRRTGGYGDDYSNNNNNNNGSQNSPRWSPVNSENSDMNNASLPPSVLECISSEIGKKWREFARNLELREGDLNNIESQYRHNIKMCAYQTLILYQSRCPNHNLQQNLLRALGKARRRDLQHTVEQIFCGMNK